MRLRNWKYKLIFAVCYLCSHTDSSRSHRGLLAPVNITTELIDDEVKVHWRDHNQPDFVSGAYAAVSEVHGNELGSPVFIHADDLTTKTITLSGLVPQMTYSIRVVLFSKDGFSASSTPVTLIMNPYLQKAKPTTGSKVVIEVNRITNHSAMLSWTFPVAHSIHGLQFKLSCNGLQAYTMNGRAVHKKYQTRLYISDALSKYTQEQLVEDLVPNVNYTCQLATYNAASQKAFLMATVHFTTLVGSFNGNWSLVTFYKEKLSEAGFTNNLTCVGHESNFAFLHISILSFEPRAPEKPRVDVDNYGITIFLIATADQFGPISHYTLIAVPVHKDKAQPITAQFTPLIPYRKVVGKAMPSQATSKSDKSVAFIIGTYPGNALPSELVLGNTNEVLSAFKPNQYYVLVLAAFTKTKEVPGSLFSLSSPSFPPFVISNSLYMYVSQHAEDEVVGEASRMVLWITGTIAILAVAVVVTSLGFAYVLKKNGYKIPLKLSDGDIEMEDYGGGLTADKYVYEEKTYVPVKPVRSGHTHHSTRFASEAAVKQFNNPPFDTSVNRTKELLEDIQVAVDCTEVSPAAENPPQSPTENCQPLTIFRLRNEEIPPTRSHKPSSSHSPFTYSTPRALEKLTAGAFFLPRSTGPIKTPRRRAPNVMKSPYNKGIPTPAPCKPTTTNTDEEPPAMASDEPLAVPDDNDENQPEALTMTINDEHPLTASDNVKQPSDDVEGIPIIIDNDNEPDNGEDMEPVTTTVSDEHPPTLSSNVVEQALTTMVDDVEEISTANNGKEPRTTSNDEDLESQQEATAIYVEHPPTISDNIVPVMIADDEEASTMGNSNDELLLTTASSDELAIVPINDGHQPTATTSENTEQPLTLADNDEVPNDPEASTTEQLLTTSDNDEQSLTMDDNSEEHAPDLELDETHF